MNRDELKELVTERFNLRQGEIELFEQRFKVECQIAKFLVNNDRFDLVRVDWAKLYKLFRDFDKVY